MEDKLHSLRAGPCEPSLGCMGLATPIPIPSAACAALCRGLWPAVAWFTPASSPPYRVLSLSRVCTYHRFIVSSEPNLLFSGVYVANAHLFWIQICLCPFVYLSMWFFRC